MCQRVANIYMVVNNPLYIMTFLHDFLCVYPNILLVAQSNMSLPAIYTYISRRKHSESQRDVLLASENHQPYLHPHILLRMKHLYPACAKI